MRRGLVEALRRNGHTDVKASPIPKHWPLVRERRRVMRYFIDYDDDEGGLIVEPLVTLQELEAEARGVERLLDTRHSHRVRLREHDAR